MAEQHSSAVTTPGAINQAGEKLQKPFEIGLVMAGAVSAGAYTAGVLDFLMEALEAWENQKGNKEVPMHQVRIKVITGASAGAITAAVLASSLRNQNFPFTNPRPLRETWVERVDIKEFLGTTDFGESDPVTGKTLVKSLLDSESLDRIAKNVFTQPWESKKWPAYFSDPLQLYFTVTNLRGIPYSIDFTADTPGKDFGMAMHADYMHFILSPEKEEKEQLNSHALPLGGALNGSVANFTRLQDNCSVLVRER